MCFSATASFTAGAALTAVGGLTVHKSQGKIELPLAMVPLLFGLQQLTEGVLWISLTHDLPTLKSVTTVRDPTDRAVHDGDIGLAGQRDYPVQYAAQLLAPFQGAAKISA